jgi:tripartite-type tricarboxylate transporter receptor subunit TctC
MPAEIVGKLNREMNAIFAMDDVKRQFTDQGVTPVGGTPAAFAEHLRTEIAKWAKVVKDTGIKPQ